MTERAQAAHETLDYQYQSANTILTNGQRLDTIFSINNYLVN